jgi:hypothetical protein
MDRAKSHNIINEISTSPAMKRMTISELGELSIRIQKFLTSQGVEKIKTSAIGNVSIKLQDILNASDVKEITNGELGHLKTKVQEILITHDKKFIKPVELEIADIKSRVISNPRGSKVIPDNGMYKFKVEVYV